jgi:hypothetical protein
MRHGIQLPGLRLSDLPFGSFNRYSAPDALSAQRVVAPNVRPIISTARSMTLNFQMRREDHLAFTREFNSTSPTFQRARTRARLMLPAMMICMWLFTFSLSGFEWTSTIIFLGSAVLWYFLYPERFDRRVERYTGKLLASQRGSLGPCELTLSDSGLHSKSNTGESTFHWSAVDRVLLTDTYLFIFLTSPMGYPIPIADVGADAAKAAYDYAVSHRTTSDSEH